MLNPQKVLEGVLSGIENGLKDNINDTVLAEKFHISQVHLARLFKFAFKRTIGAYIRSRKLAASIEDLLHTDLNVLDIALEYGFEYEQSYIRSFKQEFGITPGDLRKNGQIIKVTSPLLLFDSNKLEDGLIFGPDIVMVSQFHVIGRKHKSFFRDSLITDPYNRKKFLDERFKIPNAINHDVFMNINSQADPDADYSWFMPAVQVKTPDAVPDGFESFSFPASLCALFRFIGPVFTETNIAAADAMFSAIDNFMDNKHQKYFLERKRLNIDRFDLTANDDVFCQWEWFAPVVLKTDKHVQIYSDGIIQTYTQDLPALRIIGKKFTESSDDSCFKAVLAQLDNMRLNGMFEVIEKSAANSGDSYICLIRKTENDSYEFCLGIFVPDNTKVPGGYETIDLPKSTLNVCRVYGKKNAIVRYDTECRKKLTEEGIYYHEDEACAQWFFLRFNWRTFFEEDKFGKRIVEYCYFP